MLGSIVDEPVKLPKPAGDAGSVSEEDLDRGFPESIGGPQEIIEGEPPPPLAPAGPARARGTLIEPLTQRPSTSGMVRVRLVCPKRWSAPLKPRCRGRAKLTGAKALRYSIKAGHARRLRFHLRDGFLAKLERKPRLPATVRTRTADAADGVIAKRGFILRRRENDALRSGRPRSRRGDFGLASVHNRAPLTRGGLRAARVCAHRSSA